MRIPRTAASVVMLLFVSATAGAQLPGPAPFPMADDDLSALVAGDFSGDGHLDAVVLANGKPVLCDEVEVQQTYVWADLTTVDSATLEGTGTGGRDQLVAVGPGGLSLLELQSPAAPPWSVTTLRGAGTWWPNAVAVRTGQVDGLHGDDIVAVTPKRVLIARSDGAGGWMSDVVFVAGAAITGVELVDWDGAPGGAREIAVIMASGSGLPARIRLVQPNGATLEVLYSSSDRIVAAPLAATGIGTRYLAAVGTIDATGEQELVLIADYDMEGPWSIGPAGVYDIAAGDWTGDGIDDFVLGTNQSRDAQLYRLESDEPSVLALDPLHLPPNAPDAVPVGHPDRDPAVQDGGLALADVDHDGDIDLIAAVQGDYAGSPYDYLDPRFSSVERTLNGRVDERDYLPWPAPHAEWPEGLPVPSLSLGSGSLEVSFLTPLTVLANAELEYAVWRAPTMGSLLDPTPIAADTVQIGAHGNGSWTTVTLPLEQHTLLFPDRYILIARQVNAEGRSPALMVTFYSELDDDVYASGWNVVTSGGSVVIDGPEPGESGGHSSGVPPPPPPPDPQ